MSKSKYYKNGGKTQSQKGKIQSDDLLQAFIANLPNQNFHSEAPNMLWVGIFPTIEGWLYLAIIIDLFSKVVGLSVSERMTTDLIEWSF